MTKLSEVLIDLAAIKTLAYKPPKQQKVTEPIVEASNKQYKIVDLFTGQQKSIRRS